MLQRVTLPDSDLVTLDEIKQECRVGGSDLDDELRLKYRTALEELELETRRQFVEAEWKQYFDSFPTERQPLLIEKCPVMSVDALKYIDSAGVEQTWSSANYRVDLTTEPCRIEPAYGLSWPVARPVTNAVTVEFTAGYGTSEDCPVAAKMQVLLRTRELFEGCACGMVSEQLKSQLKWGQGWR